MSTTIEEENNNVVLPSYVTIIEKLNTAIDTLDVKVTDPDTFKMPTRPQVVKAAKTLSHEITKITLLLQDSRAKPQFFSNIEECLDNMFSIYQGLSSHSGGSLFRSSQIYFRRVYKSLLSILTDFMENEKRLGDDEENILPKERVGTAWKSCETFESIPLRNATAIAERMRELTDLMYDAFDEVDEIKDAIDNYKNRAAAAEQQGTQTQTSNGKPSAQAEQDDDDEEDEELNGEVDDDDAIDDEEDVFIEDNVDNNSFRMLTDEEMSAIESIQELSHDSYDLADSFATYITDREPTDPAKLEDPATDLDQKTLALYEDFVNQFNELSKIVDDVASGIYPPQNTHFISGNITYLRAKLNELTKRFETESITFKDYTHHDLIAKMLPSMKITDN
ncbi:hypothetical protein SAMD00019534_031680 [Acytostelium subglobosum LB1]|uniref:hypothetical protein n=1 Tax=Acytostelium subglobosum LB1 TaxID=1410327 RepID=UPI000644C369|nr:hypothetical protein SAMD00019534_031680 [Acytostelium subglobosum LB1]GAM19993.1 hypothetical protein SAMD00019534_031680 [Acytostelium subglobosum LB1]|eukprot:XP_012756755.1 hypothetical protein SAMD00019534_031680 [Acytostelium subglobosum LB1]